MSQDKIQLLRQALAASESSIKTAKQLLSEIESGGLRPSAKDLPGEVGTYDGVSMILDNGEKIEVPENYASKSMLVVGDTLKLIDEDGVKKFKQIEHVKRLKTQGILHKKDGKWKVITPEGSYNVLQSAVEHFSGEVGDEVTLHLPAGKLTAAFGAIETITKKGQPAAPEAVTAKPSAAPLPKPAPAKSAPNPAAAAPARNRQRGKKKPAVTPSSESQSAVAPKQAEPTVILPPPGSDDELR